MRFSSIDVSNYRQYKELKFSFPKNKEHDLHIIIGQNGMGKTNILNAVTWCLYGIESHLGDKSRSLPIFNLEAKKEALENGQDIINVSVCINSEVNGKSVLIRRSIEYKVETDFPFKDSFLITTLDDENNTKIFEDNDARDFINRYMPEKIREYFYFDGEQLHNYFLTGENRRIRDSVYTISQVDMLTRINDRLKNISVKKEREAGKLSPDINKINKEIQDVESQIEMQKNNIVELEKQINISDEIIKRNTDYLRGQDNLPDLEKEFQYFIEQKEKMEKERNSLRDEFKYFVQKYKIVLSFYSRVKETLRVINDKESNNHLPPNIDKNFLLKMLEEHKCLLCERDLSDAEEVKINIILDKISVSSTTSHLLMNIKSELERIIGDAREYKKEKKNLLDRLKANEENLNKIEKSLLNIDNEICKFSDKEQVRLWHNERNQHKDLFRLNNQKLGVAISQINKDEEKLLSLKNKLDSEISKLDKCEEINSMISLSKRVKKIVREIENEMMNDVKSRMERRTTEYFDKLVWKKNTYDSISLDENYQLDLIHKDGYSCVGSCSAAEMSLLALSFTLALHEVSGFNSLLFIDTPVARVSDVNRSNFADVLKEVSRGKQIIMTFSPDEYSSEVREIFESHVSTQVKLSTRDESFTEFE